MNLETFLNHQNNYTLAQVRADRELVQDLQHHLNRVGFNAGLADGVWKPQTQTALDRFEAVRGLSNAGLTPEVAQALLTTPSVKPAPTRPTPSPVPSPVPSPAPAPRPPAPVPPPVGGKPTRRRTNHNGLTIIKEFEGLRLEAYLCPAGVPTIGYGSTLGVTLGQKITPQQAEALLIKDLERFEEAVSDFVGVPLNDNQFSALVSFTFNVGAGAFRSSTLLNLLNQKHYQGAADQFLRWNRAAGRELAGLTRRREAERALFLKR